MKLRVYSSSGPACQPVKNGQPYNKWVGTIQFSDVERVMFGKRYTITVCADTKEKVIAMLDKYSIGQIVNVNPNKLKGTCKGGNNATL